MKGDNIMYTSHDIQKMISEVKTDPNFLDLLNNSGISGADKAAIAHVLKTGWFETFDRYDSAVCEQFIRLYKTFNK